MSPDAAAAVHRALDGVQRVHDVAMLVAVESGSRAWGFPSLDSDYDCRFIYVRRREDYLTLFPRRDVIELPIADDLDVNGWDIGKTLKLILKGNAVALEWLNSPLVYTVEENAREALRDFGRCHAEPSSIRSHYLHLGRQQYQVHLSGRERVAQKKIFYVLRPAAALRWLRLHPDSKVPPMDLPTLLDTCDCPLDVREIAQVLIGTKAVSREMGEAPLPGSLRSFILAEFEIAAVSTRRRGAMIRQEAKQAADELYRSLVARYAPPLPVKPRSC